MSRYEEPDLGIRSTTDLAAAGFTRRMREAALADGRLVHVRRGWYARADALPGAVTAVRIGGVLTASSAAGPHGLWAVDDPRLHVVVAGNASRLRPLADPAERGRSVCLHWADGPIAPARALAPPLQVVRDAARCLDRESAVAMADSALNKRLIHPADLREAAPSLAPWCDAASQSGTESLVRTRLRLRRIRVRTQVAIQGVGFVDLLVGDRLVIECDSRQFHDGYQSTRDYDRDMALTRRGYIVLRLQYRHVMFEWERAEALILQIVRSDRHLWRRNGGAGTVHAL